VDVVGAWVGYTGVSTGRIWLTREGLAIIEENVPRPEYVRAGAWRWDGGAIRLTYLEYDSPTPPEDPKGPPGKQVSMWLDVTAEGLRVRHTGASLRRIRSGPSAEGQRTPDNSELDGKLR